MVPGPAAALLPASLLEMQNLSPASDIDAQVMSMRVKLGGSSVSKVTDVGILFCLLLV